MEGKRRDQEEMQDSLVVEECMIVNFPLVPLPLVSFPCSSCFKVLSAKKKLNKQIVEMHKDPTSCIIWSHFSLIVEQTCRPGTAKIWSAEAALPGIRLARRRSRRRRVRRSRRATRSRNRLRARSTNIYVQATDCCGRAWSLDTTVKMLVFH